MRIAVSGTHCSGKTTLIEAFLADHKDYEHEPEPYEVLQARGELFSAEPTAEDFYQQLEYSIGRLRNHLPSDRVIFERSPFDFVAYLLVLDDLLGPSGNRLLTDRSIELAREAASLLDVIVFLPIDDNAIYVPEDENPILRSAMSECLASILFDDNYDLFARMQPIVIEARGSTMERLRTMESAMWIVG